MDFFKCEGLNKHKGDFILKDISFSFPKGRVAGLIGMNGVGKTTLIRSILGSYGIDKAAGDSGEIWLDGRNYKTDQKEYRQGLGFILQENPFSNNMKVMEVGEVYGYYYKGFDMNRFVSFLEEYEIYPKEQLSQLSAGQSLRMQLAFARSHPVKLFVLDEPAGNLDVNFRDYFYDCIREMVETEESSVIISSHLVTELEHIADDILWLGRDENVTTVRYFGDIDSFRDSYRIIEGSSDEIAAIPDQKVIGKRIREGHSEALIHRKDRDFRDAENVRYATLQEIMYYVEKKHETAEERS